MPMRTHELHPTLIHAPLVLLPVSAIVEVLAATNRSWIRRRVLDEAGRRLWWGTAASGLLAGLAGMAASREVTPRDRDAEDAMFVHGLGNLALVAGAAGIAAWRAGHRAGPVTASLGTGAVLAALYSAWLGGELVYAHGVGVKDAGTVAPGTPPLFSREAPGRLARDAAGGLRWLLTRAARAITRRDRVDVRAVAPGSEAVSGHLPRSPAGAPPPLQG